MKNHNLIIKVTVLLALATLTDNLSAASWSDWLPNRPLWVNQLLSKWTDLTPAQRNIALGSLVVGLGGLGAYKYLYRSQGPIQPDNRVEIAQSKESLDAFLTNLSSFNTQVSLLGRKSINTEKYILPYGEIKERANKFKILLKTLQKNLEIKYPLLNNNDKQEAYKAISNLDKKLDDLLKEVFKIDIQNLNLVHEALSDIERFFTALESQAFAIEKEDAQQITKDLHKAKEIIDTSAFLHKEKEALLSRLAILKQKLAEALEPEQLEAILEQQSQREQRESERKKQEDEQRRLRTRALLEHEKNKLAYEASVERGRQIEQQKMTTPSHLESHHISARSQAQKSEAQLLEEKREGKEEEPQDPSSIASLSSEQGPILSIFNNTNTTIQVTYVYASTGRAEQKLISSGQSINIPITNQDGSHLTSLRYQESSYTNPYPYIYSIDIPKIPKDTSSLLTISGTLTTFVSSITPLISQYQMILDGRELNNALRSSNQDLSDRLKEKITSLYNKYDEIPNKELAVEHYLVKSLVLYYYDIAKKLGHTFAEGTFVIYDDTGNIFKFLSSLKGTYGRSASHFNGVAQTEGRPWLAQLKYNHFGFDLDLTKEMGKRTILFNRLNKDGTELYIKPENYPPNHPMHALEFAWAQQADNDIPSYSKERVPQYIQDAYAKLLHTAEKNIQEKKLPYNLEQQLIAKLNDLRKYINKGGMGIQKMLAIAEGNPPIVKNYAPEEAQAFIAMLNNKQKSKDPKYTHLDKRFGHEVILTNEEFNQFQDL